MTINERFSKLRHELRLTKDALAEIAGTTGTSIGNIESGKTKSPSSEILAAISSKLGINLDWLVFGTGPMQKGRQSEDAGLTGGAAVVAESETLLKLAVAEAELKAARQQLEEKRAENGWLREMLGKPLSSLEAALRSFLTHGAAPAPLSMAA